MAHYVRAVQGAEEEGYWAGIPKDVGLGEISPLLEHGRDQRSQRWWRANQANKHHPSVANIRIWYYCCVSSSSHYYLVMPSFIGIERHYSKSKEKTSIKSSRTWLTGRFGPCLDTHREAIVCQGDSMSGGGRLMMGRGWTKEGLGGGPSVPPNVTIPPPLKSIPVLALPGKSNQTATHTTRR